MTQTRSGKSTAPIDAANTTTTTRTAVKNNKNNNNNSNSNSNNASRTRTGARTTVQRKTISKDPLEGLTASSKSAKAHREKRMKKDSDARKARKEALVNSKRYKLSNIEELSQETLELSLDQVKKAFKVHNTIYV